MPDFVTCVDLLWYLPPVHYIFPLKKSHQSGYSLAKATYNILPVVVKFPVLICVRVTRKGRLLLQDISTSFRITIHDARSTN